MGKCGACMCAPDLVGPKGALIPVMLIFVVAIQIFLQIFLEIVSILT